MRAIAYAIILAVAVERLVEVAWSRRNTRKLLAQGAAESGAGHYPLIILLHIAWMGTIALALPTPAAISIVPLGLFLVLQACRAWVMVSLGPYFTTRIISRPGEPLVSGGPYRILRHPNYLVVVGEVLLLPLVFGEIAVAGVFSILNALLLAWRIRVEDAALAPRR
jgi:methyltransferase